MIHNFCTQVLYTLVCGGLNWVELITYLVSQYSIPQCSLGDSHMYSLVFRPRR